MHAADYMDEIMSPDKFSFEEEEDFIGTTRTEEKHVKNVLMELTEKHDKLY